MWTADASHAGSSAVADGRLVAPELRIGTETNFSENSRSGRRVRSYQDRSAVPVI